MSRQTKNCQVSQEKPVRKTLGLRLFLEPLESRLAPAFVSAVGSPFATGSQPAFLAAGNLNGGAGPDIIIPNVGTNTISVYQITANGSLTSRDDTIVGTGSSSPFGVATGFINADANLDVVVANFSNNSIQVLTGNGAAAGDFASVGTPIPVGAGPAVVAVGQLNTGAGDDVIVTNFTAGTITVLLNNGTGTLAATSQSPIAVGSNPEFVALGNFDKSADGSIDIAVGNVSSSTVSLLFNISNSGTFTAPSNINVGTQPRGIAAADLDQDGDLDLVVAKLVTSDIQVIQNNTVVPGTPVFAAGPTFAAGGSPFGLAVADFNGDGDPDVVVGRNDTSGTSDVFLGAVGATFAAATPVANGGGTSGQGVVATDVNGDSAPDFLVTYRLSDLVTVSLNTDTYSPTVTGVFYDGTAWTSAFRAAAGNSNFGFPAQTGATQFQSMPWSTINRVTIRFSEAVNALAMNQVYVHGINTANYPVSSVTMFSATEARITIVGVFDTDRIVVSLDGSSGTAIADLAGNKLAGTFADGGTLPSSGAAGVDFKFRSSIGVGDADRNGQIRNSDTNLVRANLFTDLPNDAFNIFADIDGTGTVRNTDVNTVRSHLFLDPPAGPGPNRPVRGGLTSTRYNVVRVDLSFEMVRSNDDLPGRRVQRPLPRVTTAVLDALFDED